MDRAWIAVLAVWCGCKGNEPAPPPPPPIAKPPVRGAAGDSDLRVMLAELASSKACALMRGQFRGLRAPDQPELVTGVLWIRDCEITNDGTRVTFHLIGSGWQWAEQTKKKAGGTFEVQQYVRFDVDTKIPGAIDLAYDRKDHVLSLWFTPSEIPAVGFVPIGDVDVDRKGVWSSIIGAVGSAFADSPEEMAGKEATAKGKHEFEKQLADGLAVTINLCTGLSRFNLGRRGKGEMQPPDVGETRQVPVELRPGGVMIAGPQLAGSGMKVDAETTQGAVRMTLVCADQAETVAKAVLDGTLPSRVTVLGTADVRGKATIKIKPAKCPVAVVTYPLDNAPARFQWRRPATEIARSTGGPLIDCGKSSTGQP